MDVNFDEVFEHVMMNAVIAGCAGNGVLDGLVVSENGAGASMHVDVSTGNCIVSGTKYTEAAITENLGIVGSHGILDRKDIVIYDTSASIPAVITGTPAVIPQPPDIPAGDIILAIVNVAATVIQIFNADIIDTRVLVTTNLPNGIAGLDANTKIAARLAYENVASGVAGLDANVQLDILQMRPCLEEYSNHLGAVDNFTETVVAVNGTATADATNHEMDLSTGITSAGYALFETKKQWLPGTKPLVANFLVQNIVNGVGVNRYTQVGFSSNLSDQYTEHRATIRQVADGSWAAFVSDGVATSTAEIAALANGDLCTIVLTSAAALFYVNGVLVATRTAAMPTAAMNLGVSVIANEAGVTTARTISVDMMSIRRYV